MAQTPEDAGFVDIGVGPHPLVVEGHDLGDPDGLTEWWGKAFDARLDELDERQSILFAKLGIREPRKKPKTYSSRRQSMIAADGER